jgi:starch synthase
VRIVLLTNEYPPHVYGGAGVHVDYLSRELIRLEEGKHAVEVFCFGEQRENRDNKKVRGISAPLNLPFQDPRHQKLLDALYRNVFVAGSVREGDIVHCHTWYTHFAGCVLREILSVPLVLTVHSLEPYRPWKEEQLGSAHRVSTWLEKTAYENADGVIAVSQATKSDVHELYGVPLERIRVIPNGIDVNQYKPTFSNDILALYGVNPHRPYVLFVGRISRQKGIIHLVNAVPYLRADAQIVLCAGTPDTEDIAREMEEKVEETRARTANEIIWISETVPRDHLITLYSHAALFVCPSVYEPFGIINLEAMACNIPVVASAVGGIPEVVVQDRTGVLVPFDSVSRDNFEPKDAEQFSRDLATAINALLLAPEKGKAMGSEARKRVERYFTWNGIAEKTLDYYRFLINRQRGTRGRVGESPGGGSHL